MLTGHNCCCRPSGWLNDRCAVILFVRQLDRHRATAGGRYTDSLHFWPRGDIPFNILCRRSPQVGSDPVCRRTVSVMRRPFLFGGPRGIGRLRNLQTLRERVESGTQRGYFLLLPIHNVTELDVGVLQERNFGFNPFDGFAVHNASVTNPRRNARPSCPHQQLKPNWWFPVPTRARTGLFKRTGAAIKNLFL